MRFATIGSSSITEKWIAQSGELEDFELYAVYSRSADRARSFAKKHGASAWYCDLDRMAADPAIDAVYIASPNMMHCGQAIRMLESGKHVLCEKSLASNCKEAELMFDAASRNNVMLMEAMRNLFDPGASIIKSSLGKAGPIRRIRIEYSQYSSKYDAFLAGEERNIFSAACSGGALMDIGVYCIELLVYLFGAPDSIGAASVMLRGGIDGSGDITASWKDKTAVISYSKITASDIPCEIEGEKGSICFTRAAAPGKIRIRYNDGREEFPGCTDSDENLMYETEFFIKAAGNPDILKEYNAVSLESLRIMDEARRQCGIVFPADGA